jgi:E3 ubiquitin-protein ligase HUWE1
LNVSFCVKGEISKADGSVLISGITSVDVDELKNSTQMSGWKPGDPEISWFWRALRSFSQEERARFLMFVTSSSRVPLGGFTQLQGASGIQPFQIQKVSLVVA